MRIMLVTSLFRPLVGGASVYFDLLSSGLSKISDVERVYVLCMYLKNESIIEKHQKVWLLRCLLNLGNQSRFIKYIHSIIIPIIILFLSKLLRVNLIHYHSLTSYKAIHYLSHLFRVPLICDMRDLAAKNEGASLTYYRHAAKIICCSENIFKFVQADDFLQNKAVSIPIPFEVSEKQKKDKIDAIKRKYGIDPDIEYLCFAGAIVEYKGIFELIKAFQLIVAKGYKGRLVIIGPMELRKRSRSFKKYYTLINNPSIKYLGPLSRVETLGIIQGSNIFVLPSISESISRVCLEAISLGVKTVLPGCVPEFRKFCPEFVINEISPIKLSEKIEKVSNFTESPTYPFHHHDPAGIINQTYSLYLILGRTN